MEETIINKVANSGLMEIDLSRLIPKGERFSYDLKQNLYQELILKEKDFRLFLKEHPWTNYQDKYVFIYCSEDVIIPFWAYMLLAVELKPFAKKIVFGNREELEKQLLLDVISTMDTTQYQDKRVIIKGCGEEISEAIYIAITHKLTGIAKSIMYGEACSTVPI